MTRNKQQASSATGTRARIEHRESGPDQFVPSGLDPLTQAFARREFVVPWQGSTPVAAHDIGDTIQRIFDTPRRVPAVAYIHVPYCQNHCLFCGFFQNAWRVEASAAYVDDVVDEMARLGATPLVASAPIEAVYIGGGTPSALAADDLARLIANLRCLLPLSPDCEITVEGRAYDFGVLKAAAALAAGANRISIGVQSFDTSVRRPLGRKLTGAEVRAFLADLVALDQASVVCDLIYGLPGQDAAIWQRDVDTVIDLGLDGLTIYALNVWNGGPLAKAIGSGKLPPAESLASQARAYVTAVERLTAGGWRQISQSHFAPSPRERNRYNSLIKGGAICLPFGPGAGGHAHGYRWRNVIDIERRRRLRADGDWPIEGLAKLPPHHVVQTTIAAGLEAGELDLRAIDEAVPGFLQAVTPLIENWIATGLGEMVAERFRTTCAGAFWATNLNSGLSAVLERVSLLEIQSRTY